MSRRPSPLVAWRQQIVESALGKNARLVAFVLSTHMDRNGGSCFPSLTTLERETRLVRSTVCRALIELEGAGAIKRSRGNPSRSTRYLATSPPTGLPLVRGADSGSPPSAHEDVHEDVYNPSPRLRAGGKRQGRRAKGARPAGHAHPDSSYLDEAGR